MMETNKGDSLCDEGRDSGSPTHKSANTFLICRSQIKYSSEEEKRFEEKKNHLQTAIDS